MARRDYVGVIYSAENRPYTTYPAQLTRYLADRFEISNHDKLLDVGCGRGEFLKGFRDLGINVSAVDLSASARELCPEVELQIANIEQEGIPYADNTFDVVYSKSVIEHFYFPERFMAEVFRVLKPGGRCITLCPAWEYNYRSYFEDYTHRTPFMYSSLADIQAIAGFNNIEVEYFIQLPSTWKKNPSLSRIGSALTRLIAPDFLKSRFKWVRFSKEIMLLSSSRKPEFDDD